MLHSRNYRFFMQYNLSYPSADVVGSESDVFCFKVDPSLPWIAYNVANTGTHQIDAHGLASFGTFTGNIGNAAVPPSIRSLQDKIISSGMSECADASQTLVIAGMEQATWFRTAEVESYCRSQHYLLSRDQGFAGGYLHGTISTSFCNPYNHPAVAPLVSGVEDPGNSGIQDNSFFKIYPNPTPGNFTVD